MWEIIIFLATVIAIIMILRKLPVDVQTEVSKDPDKTEKTEEKIMSLQEQADGAFEANDLKKAEKLYLKILSEEPTDAFIYNRLGLIYLQDKNFKDAASALKHALKIDPDNDTFLNNLGLLYYETENYDEAVEAYEKSLEINDRVSSRLVNLGLAYFMAKKYRKAADSFEKALIIDPRNENYLDLLKQAEEKLK